MLHIACVKWGVRYGADYVNILRDMTLRNLPDGTEGRFVCFTDDPAGIDPSINTEPLPGHLEGWWNKLWLFNPEAFPAGDRVLYFDLDTVICGPLDGIADYRGPFATLRDFYRPRGLQSSVMAFWAAGNSAIYTEFAKAGFPKLSGGDQEWIELALRGRKPDLWQDLFPGAFVSYREHARFGIPKGATVINFHGDPKPHECGDWVPEVWKVGGGTSASLMVQANVPVETITSNIRAAMAREDARWLDMREPHDGVALICAGGPSLSDALPSLAARKRAGASLFSINGTLRYLESHSIETDCHVILDARPENFQFVCPEFKAWRVYSSQCDRSVQDCADMLWHPYFDGVLDIVGHEQKSALIGGGTTAGLKAIVIAYVMGYREIHLYGFDSSYRGDDNHAYTQPMNAGERIIEVNLHGEIFRCAPWMVAQAEDFRVLIPNLIARGCEIHVHGDGLIPAISRAMMPEEIDGDFKKANGMWWPKDDLECAASIPATIGDIDAIIGHCTRRGVAVQAGGNVGAWPIELSRHFRHVLTFEPDADNFECLWRNTQGVKNISAAQLGLSNATGKIGLAREPDNCGAHYAIAGDECDVLPLDTFQLSECDLIQLDIEGLEPLALQGAIETIKRTRPVIVTEEKNMHRLHGEMDVASVLVPLGYRARARIHHDVIYVPEGDG